MTQDATYLRITIHDNDYTKALMLVGESLQNIFYVIGGYPTVEDIPVLKKMMKHLLYGTENIIRNMLGYAEYRECDLDYFDPRLEFVDFKDIPDNDNLESVYVPMFDGEILVR